MSSKHLQICLDKEASSFLRLQDTVATARNEVGCQAEHAYAHQDKLE
jgi:hypothetical protein